MIICCSANKFGLRTNSHLFTKSATAVSVVHCSRPHTSCPGDGVGGPAFFYCTCTCRWPQFIVARSNCDDVSAASPTARYSASPHIACNRYTTTPIYIGPHVSPIAPSWLFHSLHNVFRSQHKANITRSHWK